MIKSMTATKTETHTMSQNFSEIWSLKHSVAESNPCGGMSLMNTCNYLGLSQIKEEFN